MSIRDNKVYSKRRKSQDAVLWMDKWAGFFLSGRVRASIITYLMLVARALGLFFRRREVVNRLTQVRSTYSRVKVLEVSRSTLVI